MMVSVTPDAAPAPAMSHALLRFALLAALAVLLIRADLEWLVRSLPSDPESAHIIAMPLLVTLMWWNRRETIRRESTGGSALGLALILLGVALYIVCAFPFNYLQPRRMSVAVMFAGALVFTMGWRATLRWIPMLLVLIVSIPVGMRFFARLIVRAETITLEFVTRILDALSGAEVTLNGLDMLYHTVNAPANVVGTIALGEPNRGVQYPLALVAMLLFVTFIRIRPWWQLVIGAITALPILFLANLSRLTAWGFVTIWTDAHPTSAVPRHVGIFTCLLVVTVATGLVYFILDNLVASDATSPDDATPTETAA